MFKKIVLLFLSIVSVISLFIFTVSADETININTDTIYINNVPITCYSNSKYGPYFIVSDLKKIHFDSIWNSETRTVKIAYSSDSIALSKEESEKIEKEVVEALKFNHLNFPDGNINECPKVTLQDAPLYEGWSPNGAKRAEYAIANGHTLIKVQAFIKYYSSIEPDLDNTYGETPFSTNIHTLYQYPVCKDRSGNSFPIKENFYLTSIRSYWSTFYVTDDNNTLNSYEDIIDATTFESSAVYIPFETSLLGKCSISENTITIEELSPEKITFSHHSGPTQNMSYLPTATVDTKLMWKNREITANGDYPIFLSINGRLFICADVFSSIPKKIDIIPDYFPF